jgi:hypothetical protein
MSQTVAFDLDPNIAVWRNVVARIHALLRLYKIRGSSSIARLVVNHGSGIKDGRRRLKHQSQ